VCEVALIFAHSGHDDESWKVMMVHHHLQDRCQSILVPLMKTWNAIYLAGVSVTKYIKWLSLALSSGSLARGGANP